MDVFNLKIEIMNVIAVNDQWMSIEQFGIISRRMRSIPYQTDSNDSEVMLIEVESRLIYISLIS